MWEGSPVQGSTFKRRSLLGNTKVKEKHSAAFITVDDLEFIKDSLDVYIDAVGKVGENEPDVEWAKHFSDDTINENHMFMAYCQFG